MPVINTNTAANSAQRNLGKAEAMVSSSVDKLSSGNRISGAKDDAAGLSISKKIENIVSGLTAASRNVAQASALLDTAENGLIEISDILARMKELAVSSVNDALTDDERAQNDKEFKALITQFTKIANETRWTGKSLLDGNGGDGSGNFNFQSAEKKDDLITLALTQDYTASGLQLDSSDVATFATAQTAQDSIDAALLLIQNGLADIGATSKSMEVTASNLSALLESNTAANSVILDADFGEETTNFATAQVKQQAAVSVLAKANELASLVLKLLN